MLQSHASNNNLWHVFYLKFNDDLFDALFLGLVLSLPPQQGQLKPSTLT